jgi:anaerobic selenocysteine-containing dehydrogenase
MKVGNGMSVMVIGDPHAFDFCENGAKATLWELDTCRADPDFFTAHTLSDLCGWHDHDLEKSGRLTYPMRYDPASDRYLPVNWEQAFADIGRELRGMHPREAVFHASGHAGLEASYLYALFARAMCHQNLPQSSNMCHETTSVTLLSYIGTSVGTCMFDDFDQCDTILFFGQNTGSNSLRFWPSTASTNKMQRMMQARQSCGSLRRLTNHSVGAENV